jgi:GDP-4-dehydro-6-deoxy-D-mannose reductase
MKRKKNISKIDKVLITGITGSGGSYLAEYIYLNHKNVEINGIARWHSTTNNSNIKNIEKNITIHECDLNDFSSILKTLEKIKPDVIFHMASYANVRASFLTPSTVMQNNIIGTSNLLEAIKFLKLDPIIQMCSTSEVYGQVLKREIPIRETNPIRPASPYAISKVAQDFLAQNYFKSYGMKIIITRMFSYLNPRRTDLFATSFAKQVAWIEYGLQKKLFHGNLESVRTIIDVRDAMRSYWESIIYCDYGEVYNIGGIKKISVGNFLDKLIKMSTVKIQTSVKKSLFRPTDVTLQIPDTSKFFKKTGFKPRYKFDDSLNDLLNYWRNQAKKEILISKNK